MKPLPRISFLALAATALPAFAQTAAETAQAAAPVVAQKTLWDKVILAGPVFMGLLFLASTLMVWLVIDGLMRTRRTKLVPPAVEQSIREHLVVGDYLGAHAAASADTSVFSLVCAGAFSKIGLGKDPVDDAIFEEIERERGAFNSRVSYLSVIGVITPMIGLTGTVFGMIHAFDTLGSSGVGDPAKLSEAIGEVLVCTGGGLVVAIPAFALYYVLRNRITGGFRHVQSRVNAIFHHLPYGHLAGVRLETDAFIPALPVFAQPGPGVADALPDAQPAA